MLIRNYEHSDFAQICKVHNLARKSELREAGLEDAYVPLEIAHKTESLFKYNLKVAEFSNEVIGFVAYAKGELAWLYVNPLFFNHGAGRMLVESVKKENIGETIELEVIASNNSAIKFYKKMGFEVDCLIHGEMHGNERFMIDVYVMKYPCEDGKLEVDTFSN